MPSTPPPCAYCRRRAAEDRFRPFCSERCKMADLGRWLTGAYRVPGPPSTSTGDPAVDPYDETVVDDDDRIR